MPSMIVTGTSTRLTFTFIGLGPTSGRAKGAAIPSVAGCITLGWMWMSSRLVVLWLEIGSVNAKKTSRRANRRFTRKESWFPSCMLPSLADAHETLLLRYQYIGNPVETLIQQGTSTRRYQ